jgi:hypothetical protein
MASAEQAAQPPDDGPRVYAKTRFVWIREWPTSEVQWIGFLWTGGSVKLKSEKVHYGPGCNEWYEVEPHGFVCVDGKRATLDAKDPVLLAQRPYRAKLDSPWPHEYAESTGLKRYRKLPNLDIQKKLEWDLEQQLEKSYGARTGIKPDEDPFEQVTFPNSTHEGRTGLLPLSTVAYAAEIHREERDWLLAADMTWIPKDRVKPYPKVTFKGVDLKGDVKLPLAFFRGEDRPKYRHSGEAFEATRETFKRLSHVGLTGKSVTRDDVEFLETREEGIFVKKDDAVVPTPQKTTPWGAQVGGKDEGEGRPEGRATWMEASVWGGWLIAYEGTKPVYATMISPGRGGTPVKGKNPIETASTPVGRFPITGKFATATMEAPGDFIHSDVPWTQNFSGPHALHGAYWHDDWGKLKSGGCVNVSPIDGKWLYEWTDPQVPEGWHGVRWLPSKLPSTLFIVHK